jgi:hypothetical protein
MIPIFTQGFLDFIDSELQAVSKGVVSTHHVHNVQSGITNILALLEPDEIITDASGTLAQMAASYINRHDCGSMSIAEREANGDTARFSIALAALAAFRASLERGRPNFRVQRLGLR